jgi:hypothetical protein
MVEIKRRLRNADALLSAAKEYVNRMEKIYDDDSYQGVWGLAYVHGIKYTGPNDVNERASLRKAIAACEKED